MHIHVLLPLALLLLPLALILLLEEELPQGLLGLLELPRAAHDLVVRAEVAALAVRAPAAAVGLEAIPCRILYTLYSRLCARYSKLHAPYSILYYNIPYYTNSI